MKAKVTVLTTLFFLSIVSCLRYDHIVSLWKFDNSMLYMNSMDTCITVSGFLSDYNMELSVRHHDDFRMNGIRFKLQVSTEDSVMCDTLVMPLVDSTDYWDGIPYIGAYVKKIPVKIQLPSSDSAKFSITPLMSDALSGVDWVAFELIKQ